MCVCMRVCVRGHKRPRKEQHPRARNSISFEKWKMFRFYPILPTSRLAIRVLPDDISRRVFTRILKLFNKNGRGAAPSPLSLLIINTRINNKSEEQEKSSLLVFPIVITSPFRSILESSVKLQGKKKKKMFLKWSKLARKKKNQIGLGKSQFEKVTIQFAFQGEKLTSKLFPKLPPQLVHTNLLVNVDIHIYIQWVRKRRKIRNLP